MAHEAGIAHYACRGALLVLVGARRAGRASFQPGRVGVHAAAADPWLERRRTARAPASSRTRSANAVRSVVEGARIARHWDCCDAPCRASSADVALGAGGRSVIALELTLLARKALVPLRERECAWGTFSRRDRTLDARVPRGTQQAAGCRSETRCVAECAARTQSSGSAAAWAVPTDIARLWLSCCAGTDEALRAERRTPRPVLR